MVYSGNFKDPDWMVSGIRYPASSARTLRNLVFIIILFPIIALVAFLFQIYIWVILFETSLDFTENTAVSIILVTISAIIILLTTIKGLPDTLLMIGGEIDDIEEE